MITRVARQLGIGTESLRGWMRQAEVDGGRPGTTTADAQHIAELDREVRVQRTFWADRPNRLWSPI